MSKESLDARLDEEGRNWIERAKAMDERMEREEKERARQDRNLKALILVGGLVAVAALVVAVYLVTGGRM